MILPAKILITAPPAAMAVVLLAQESVQPVGARMDPTLFAAAVVTVIAALGGVAIQIISAISQARDRRDAATERRMLIEKADAALEKTTASVEKADMLIGQTAEIHSMANSTNSNLQKALELMTEKNTGLERLMQQMETEKRQTAATREMTDLRAAIASPGGGPAAESLENIDESTLAIKDNTAKTVADVKELKTVAQEPEDA